MNDKNFVNEIKTLDDIERIESEVRRSGKLVTNISHWNPSSFYFNEVLNDKPDLAFYTSAQAHEYNYSYYLRQDDINNLKIKIGDNTDSRECLVTPSGTASINCVLDLLKNKHKVANLLIINPSYFSVYHMCRTLKINTVEDSVLKPESNFALNRKSILEAINRFKRSRNDNSYAIWITNPIFSSGQYYSDSDIAFLKQVLIDNKRLYLVADECFGYNGNEMLKKLCDQSRFISIHDPWKQLCFCGYKFSVVSYDRESQKHIEEWSDILYGSLPASSIYGLSVFLSKDEDFWRYQDLANRFYEQRLSELYERTNDISFVSVDKNVRGPYVSCYFPAKNYALLSSDKSIRSLVSKTGVSIIPNHRNRYPSNLGFSFRINLAKFDGDSYWDKVIGLFKYVQTI